MKKLRLILLSVLFALTVFALTACSGVEIDVTERRDGDEWYFDVDIAVPQTMVNSMNLTAANRSGNLKWTFGDWLERYLEVTSENHGLESKYLGSAENGTIYSFSVYAAKGTTVPTLIDALDVTADVTPKVRTNLFYRTVNVERDDRFNYWIKAYEQARAKFIDDGSVKEISDYQTVVGIILFGCRDVYSQYKTAEEAVRDGITDARYDQKSGVVYVETLPALWEAFPYAEEMLKNAGYRDVVLRNFWYASRHINSNCVRTVAAKDSDGVTDRFGRYYVFEKDMGKGDTTVEYEYYRADPTGWYILAIVLALLTVGLVYLIARQREKNKSRQPQQVQDSFPYDPFADGMGGGSIDPFAEYSTRKKKKNDLDPFADFFGGDDKHDTDPFA